MYERIKEMLTKRKINLKQVVSVTTGGAPGMARRERGGLWHG